MIDADAYLGGVGAAVRRRLDFVLLTQQIEMLVQMWHSGAARRAPAVCRNARARRAARAAGAPRDRQIGAKSATHDSRLQFGMLFTLAHSSC